MKQRVLVCRTDRLGDVLLSLPAILSLRQSLGSQYEVDLLIAQDLVELLEPLLRLHHIEAVGYERSSKQWWNQVIKRSYAGAVCLHFDAPVAAALKQARIPLRLGPYSKFGSLLAFNRGTFQRRSRALKSEAEYGVELVEMFLARLGQETTIAAPAVLPEQTAVWLHVQEKTGLTPGYWVLHPGMGGSAENLSIDAYADLIRRLSAKAPKGKIVIGLGPAPADRKFRALLKLFPEAIAIEGLSLKEYAEVFRNAARVVAPSTGPLHLAHWVGTSTLGLFSPVRAHHARRWQPFGSTGQSQVWWPDVACPAKKQCLGPGCAAYFCMEKSAPTIEAT